jgi:hypothetical protein
MTRDHPRHNGTGWMTKTAMPSSKRRLHGTKSLLYWTTWRKRIKTLATSPLKDCVLRGLILYQKIIRMKFKKDRIISSKMMNRNKILCSIKNMKDII